MADFAHRFRFDAHTRRRLVWFLFGVTVIAMSALVIWWAIFIRGNLSQLREMEQERLRLRAMVAFQHWLRIEDSAESERVRAEMEADGMHFVWAAQAVPTEGKWLIRDNAGSEWSLLVDTAAADAVEEEYSRRVFMIVGEGFFFFTLIAGGLVLMLLSWRSETRLNEAMDAFVAGVTHELKTPLASVRLLLETLRDNPRALKDPQRSMDGVLREVALLDRMVETILLSSRLAGSGLRLESQPVELRRLVTRTLEGMRLALEKAQAQVEVIGEGDYRVNGDETMLERVLVNLLDNAVKYSSGPPRITIRLENTTGGVQLCVADEGIGLQTGEQEAVFERFFRSPQARGHRGSGLGLYVCRALVEAMGGRIAARSAGPGRGTEFCVELRETTSP